MTITKNLYLLESVSLMLNLCSPKWFSSNQCVHEECWWSSVENIIQPSLNVYILELVSIFNVNNVLTLKNPEIRLGVYEEYWSSSLENIIQPSLSV